MFRYMHGNNHEMERAVRGRCYNPNVIDFIVRHVRDQNGSFIIALPNFTRASIKHNNPIQHDYQSLHYLPGADTSSIKSPKPTTKTKSQPEIQSNQTYPKTDL